MATACRMPGIQAAKNMVPSGRARCCVRPRRRQVTCAAAERNDGLDTDVVIVGGGPGGLALANALARVNVSSVVCERARALKPIGGYVVLTPNGLKALNAIGPELFDAVESRGDTKTGSQVHTKSADGTGTWQFVNVPDQLSAEIERLYGYYPVTLGWHALQTALASRLDPDISPIILGQRFAGYEETLPGGVVAHFEPGPGVTTPIRARLLVGCDGAKSVVRERVLRDGPPTYSGFIQWTAVVPSPDDWPPVTGQVTYVGTGLTRFSVSTVGMGARGRPLLAWGITDSEPPSVAASIGADAIAWAKARYDPPGRERVAARRKARLLAAVGDDFPPNVMSLLTATPAVDIAESTLCDRIGTGPWGAGRVTLCGDAAHPIHPILGQGANLAMEDAWCLASMMAKYGPTPEALRQYEIARKPRVERLALDARSQSDGMLANAGSVLPPMTSANLQKAALAPQGATPGPTTFAGKSLESVLDRVYNVSFDRLRPREKTGTVRNSPVKRR